MTNPHGSWIWYELMTPDAQASRTFYAGVVGWHIDAESMAPGGAEYRILHAPDGDIGGMLTLDAAMLAAGAKPAWLGYIGVTDVDATVDRLKAAGGSVHVPPTDIPDVGRFAMVADPQGVPFYLMRGFSDRASTAYSRTETGHVSWNELQTSDADAGFAFYSGLFGWHKAGGMPMPWGEYSFVHGGEEPAWGAIMPRETPEQPVGWTYYFRVPDIEVAHAAVRALGGTALSDPMTVPGGDRVFHAIDPQGAGFGLVASK